MLAGGGRFLLREVPLKVLVLQGFYGREDMYSAPEGGCKKILVQAACALGEPQMRSGGHANHGIHAL